jgi:membrane protein YqaA with SNARE-associated domain
MQWLVKIYDKTLVWSQHQHAPRYLAAVSFVESSVFPIPPYFMLAPMALAKPNKALQYALIATVASVLGGLLGYLLGYYVFVPVVLPVINFFGLMDSYVLVAQRFHDQSFWAVFFAILVAGVMPIPYKIIAIGAGVMQVAVIPFVLASIIGRGLKFYLVSVLIKFGGVKMEQQIRQLIEKLGLILVCIALAVLGLKIFKVI